MTTKVSGALLATPGRKNVIINGGMDIWQRGTSFTSVINGAYTADRANIFFTTGTWDITRDTSVPTVAESGRRYNYSWRVDCTATGTLIASSEFSMAQRIEGYNYNQLYQQPQTISFWIKGNKTGAYGVSVRASGLDLSYVSDITINSADTWEKKTVVISAISSGGTWVTTNGIGAFLSFCFLAGLSLQTTADAWQTGNKVATSAQVDLSDSTSNYIQITGIQLEKGTVATEFEYRPIGEELALCQRYFEKSYNVDTAPGTITNTGMTYIILQGINISTHLTGSNIQLVTKRGTPTMTGYSTATGTTGQARDFANAVDVAVSFANAGNSQVRWTATGGSANQFQLAVQWTASSEL